jgi:hypothetical protein
MVLKCIIFLAAALILANCCASGNGCAPVTGGPVAWDGLGPAPTEDTQPLKPKKPAHAKREIVVGPLDAAPGGGNNKVQSTEHWEQQQVTDQDDEVRLKRKLVICRSCAPNPTAHDDAASADR